MPPKRKTWCEEDMKKAVEIVRNKEMGYLKASKVFNVPKGTLERYVKDTRSANDLVAVRLGRKPALPEDLETQLVDYCIQMEKRFYGLRQRDIKCMAYQLAIKNGISHPFSRGKETAGKKWLRGFLTRNKQLSMRTPQGVSAARVKAFTSENVNVFFDIYEAELQKIKCLPHRLFNVDETGITVVQHKHSKVLALKGKKQVCSLTSMERGKLITVVTCMNAAGTFVPPLIVFPRKNMSEVLMEGAPRGSVWACHPSGWIQAHIFTQWFSHFLSFTKPTQDDPVLLVLDGHYSHTRNVDVIDMAKQNHVAIVCLPPHSTHKMQPLDVGFMSPFKTYYAQEIETWLKNNPGRTVPNTSICKLFGTAYERAATMEVSINSFRKTGLFPCNRNIFRGHDFAIHESNQVNIPSHEAVYESSSDIQPVHSSKDCELAVNFSSQKEPVAHSSRDFQPATNSSRHKEPVVHSSRDRELAAYYSSHKEPVAHSSRDCQPSSNSSRHKEPVAHSSRDCEPIAHSSMDYDPIAHRPADCDPIARFLREKTPELDRNLIGPFDITPIPQLNVSKATQTKSRTQTAKLITSTPYKENLVESQNKRKSKPKFSITQSKGSAKTKRRTKTTKKRKSLKEESSEASYSPETVSNLIDMDSDDDDIGDNDDAECIFCTGRFSDDRHGEKWARCKTCYRWAHEDCGEITGQYFLCSVCELVSISNKKS